jgi:putative ABC transport system permease protein
VRLRGLRAIVIGEAGFRLALALGAVAALTAFVAAAGPREVTASQNAAVQRALAAIPHAQTSIVVTADWYPQPGRPATVMTRSQQALFGSAMVKSFPKPITVPADGIRAYLASPLVQVPAAAPSATMDLPPELQLNYDSDLTADARLISGRWPGTAHHGLPGHAAADRDAEVLQVALTQANAARFGLRPGSFQELGVLGGRPVWLQVTGVIQPRPQALFWGSSDALSAPYPTGPMGGRYWVGGAIVSPAEFTAMQSVDPSTDMHAEWYFPILVAHLTPQQLGPLAAAISASAGSNAPGNAASAIGSRPPGCGRCPPSSFPFNPPPVVDPELAGQLAGQLTAIQAQLAATSGIDSLVVGGLFAAGLLLMLLCAGLAADRYEAELALTRARGASLLQISMRALARSLGSTAPGLAVGIGLGTLAGVASSSPSAVILPALTAIMAIGSVPVRCTWRVRKSDSAHAAQRSDLSAPRRSPRRVVAEMSVLAITAGAVVALRVRGLQAGSDQLAVVSPVLVAIAASIAVGRLYPIPIRGLLPLAARRRGPVGFLGLTKTGRAGLATILPALALVLTLTLAAFGWMLTQSVTAGQLASSWSQSGADAVITAAGNNTISVADARSFAALPRVRHTALVYTALGTTPFAPSLISPAGKSVPLGLAIVNPAPYAELSADTPWTGFPASALARGKGPVPILISAAAAAVPGVDGSVGSHQVLELGGIRLPVAIAGTIAATPAFPTGGPYVMMPQWAEGSFPSIPGPSTLLVTGPNASPTAMAALAAREVHGSQVILRAALVHAQQVSAAEYAVRLFVLASWAAAALSVVALSFGLAATARSRRNLRTRMAGLGMSSRQARALAMFDPVSLLTVAVAGMVVAGTTLSLISRQVINLAALTSSATPAPVALNLAAILIPAVGVIVVALAAVATEHALASRADPATALRYEEVS